MIHKVDVSPVSQRYSTPTVLPVNAQIIRLIAFASNGLSSNCLIDFSLFLQKIQLRIHTNAPYLLNLRKLALH